MRDDGGDLVGQILLGKLEVIRRLGHGGMGEVYEVEHRLTGHRRALKVVHPRYADRPRFMKRLLREAKVAGTLATDHVVETYDAGRLEDGSAYVLMELLDGRSLFEALGGMSMAPRRLARIMAQVAEGMALAHAAGIIHRDLKPENVFLIGEENAERVKILDFGVSKFDAKLHEAPSRLTAEGTLVGTPYYMSPEQASGEAVDARTDVYAMGVMMYEALTGRLPFEADSVGELFVKIAAGQCVPLEARMPQLDPRWHGLVHRAFDRAPEKRFPNAEALRRELLPLVGGDAPEARSDGARSTREYSERAAPPPKTPRGAVSRSDTAPPATAPTEAPAAEPAEAEPRDDGEPTEGPSKRRDDEDSNIHALSGPPPSGRAALPAWAWAALGTLLVVFALAPLALDRGRAGPEEHPPPAATTEPELETSPPQSDLDVEDSDPPVEPVEVAGGAEGAAVGAPDAGPTSTPRPPGDRSGRRGAPDPAQSAGLDPNPYR